MLIVRLISADGTSVKHLSLMLLRLFMGVGLLVISYEVLIHLHPPAIAAGLTVLGRNPNCPLTQAYDGLIGQATQRLEVTAIAAATKLAGSDGGLNRYETPQGQFWIPHGSDVVLPKLLAQQAANIYGSIEPGDVVIDCGAHVGTYARQAINAGAKLVVAIEPAPDNVECLRRAFAQEITSGKLVVIPKGVWDREDLLTLYADPKNSAADSLMGEGKPQTPESLVRFRTLIGRYKTSDGREFAVSINGDRLMIAGPRHTERPNVLIPQDGLAFLATGYRLQFSLEGTQPSATAVQNGKIVWTATKAR